MSAKFLSIKNLWNDTSLQIKIMASLLAGLVFLLPYERIPSIPLNLGAVNFDLRLSFIVGGLLLVATAVAVFKQPAYRDRLKHPIYGLLGSFLFVYLLSVLVSTDIKRGVSVWVFTAFTIAVGVAVSLAWRHRNDELIGRALRITTWLVLFFGFYQYVGDLLGLPTSFTGLRDIYTKVVFGVPRIQSTGLEPLYYANFLLIPLFYFSARFLRGEEERPYLIALIMTQLILTLSRGALYAGLVGLALLLTLTIRKLKPVQGFGYIGLLVAGVILAFVFSAIPARTPEATTPTPSNTSVTVIQQATNLDSQDDRVRNRVFAWQAFQAYPVLGIGPGNFSQYAKARYVGYENMEGYLIVNNEPLELLAEGGAISFLLLVTFLIWLMWRLLVVSWKPSTSTAWSCGIASYLVALAIQYQAFSTLYIMHVWVAIGIALGIVLNNEKVGLKKHIKRTKN